MAGQALTVDSIDMDVMSARTDAATAPRGPGQDKPVFIYKMIARDTVEEKILQLQDRKRALVSQLIATETGLFKSLTKQDIELLFE